MPAAWPLYDQKETRCEPQEIQNERERERERKKVRLEWKDVRNWYPRYCGEKRLVYPEAGRSLFHFQARDAEEISMLGPKLKTNKCPFNSTKNRTLASNLNVSSIPWIAI